MIANVTGTAWDTEKKREKKNMIQIRLNSSLDSISCKFKKKREETFPPLVRDAVLANKTEKTEHAYSIPTAKAPINPVIPIISQHQLIRNRVTRIINCTICGGTS
jgi:hypothetical protein